MEKMWITMSTLAHWINNGETTDPWFMVDDGDRVNEVSQLIGRAFISLLHLLDLAGQLEPDSEFRDLELVMSLYLKWSEGQLADIRDELGDEDGNDSRETIAQYAKKGGLDLVTNGCYGMKPILDQLYEDNPETLKASKAGDRWKWSKTVSQCSSQSSCMTD